jgi:hypothetical protein
MPHPIAPHARPADWSGGVVRVTAGEDDAGTTTCHLAAPQPGSIEDGHHGVATLFRCVNGRAEVWPATWRRQRDGRCAAGSTERASPSHVLRLSRRRSPW